MPNEKHIWTRDDTILAFELYCTIPHKDVTVFNPQIVELSQRIDVTPNSVKLKLQNFKAYDSSYTQDGRIGLAHGSKLDAEIVSAFLNDWDSLILETEKIKAQLGIVNASADKNRQDEEIIVPQGYTYEQVKRVRVGQDFFRKTILASYDNRCCITGLSIPKLLIASHIKPWCASDENEKTNPQNGLLLNALFDAIFDKGYITIDKNFKVVLSTMLKNSTDQFVRISIYPYADRKILLPQRFLPDKNFLQYHNDVIFIR
jgi:putative restriction endonuclease